MTHDGRTIRFPHPDIRTNDTVKFNLETQEIDEVYKFEPGNTVMITGGNNIGRVGTISHFEKHPGSFDIVHVKDAKNHSFATRAQNVFAIGQGKKTSISLLKDRGIKKTIIEERDAKQE